MGTFAHHPDGYFAINGEKFSEEVFLSVEPGYVLADGRIGQYYEQGKGHWETDGSTAFAGEFPWTQGDIYINRLSDFQAARADDKEADSYAVMDAETARFDAYTPESKRYMMYPSKDDLIEALFRHVVEGEDLDISGCNALQAMIDSVRAQYPDA